MSRPRLPHPATAAEWMIRPLVPADRAALLRLNARNQPAVHALDEATLDWFLGFGGEHLAAVNAEGQMLGYLLSQASGSSYDDTEIRDLRRRLPEPFHYICQVVIGPDHRGRGIGRALYAAVAEVARRRGVAAICSDVNTDPPNPGSLAFHRRLGFEEIGTGVASNGFSIVYLARRLRGDDELKPRA